MTDVLSFTYFGGARDVSPTSDPVPHEAEGPRPVPARRRSPRGRQTFAGFTPSAASPRARPPAWPSTDYADARAAGSFIRIDELTSAAAAAGLVDR